MSNKPLTLAEIVAATGRDAESWYFDDADGMWTTGDGIDEPDWLIEECGDYAELRHGVLSIRFDDSVADDLSGICAGVLRAYAAFIAPPPAEEKRDA